VFRRSILTLTTLAAVAMTVALLAPPALATSPSLAQLRQERSHVRSLLAQARQRHRDAAADLAAARELAARLAAAGISAPAAVMPAVLPSPATVAPAATHDGLVPDGMDSQLASALLADGEVTAEELGALQARLAATRRQVKRWSEKLERLTRRIHRREQIARWAREHTWRPLIRIAGEKYGVDPGGLERMMMLESGGDPRVVGGIYNGLFQYTHSEWARHWNPYRHESIYDGWAQIRATALALSKGMGPGQWPNTYRMAF
jgi:soluble lytic murein transglycosylase-like protein